jgi:hypothetical protein
MSNRQLDILLSATQKKGDIESTVVLFEIYKHRES